MENHYFEIIIKTELYNGTKITNKFVYRDKDNKKVKILSDYCIGYTYRAITYSKYIEGIKYSGFDKLRYLITFTFSNGNKEERIYKYDPNISIIVDAFKKIDNRIESYTLIPVIKDYEDIEYCKELDMITYDSAMETLYNVSEKRCIVIYKKKQQISFEKDTKEFAIGGPLCIASAKYKEQLFILDGEIFDTDNEKFHVYYHKLKRTTVNFGIIEIPNEEFSMNNLKKYMKLVEAEIDK